MPSDRPPGLHAGWRAWLRRQRVASRAWFPTPASPDAVAFRCNICGARSAAPEVLLRDREAPSCRACGSNQRYRALVASLQSRLLGEVIPLRLQPRRLDLRGLGTSDSDVYAPWLATRYAYTNTFFHAAPFLDLTAPDPRWFGRHDFVTCSDVLEHVAPPVATAFATLRRLLKPDGILALTVPYVPTGTTVEHFPELHDFRLEGTGAKRRLLNRTRDGREQIHDGLRFHGGDGATLEMRVFALPDLLRLLDEAGFRDLRVHGEPLPAWGILPDGPCSLPITARAADGVQAVSTGPMR